MELDICMKHKFKIIISLFVILYFAILGLMFNFDRELAIKDAKNEATRTLQNIQAIRQYISQTQRPLIENLKQKGLLNKDFFDERLLSASFITEEIYKIQFKNQEYNYKLIALNPINPHNIGNEFENSILQGFKDKKYQEYSKIIKEDGKYCVLVSLPIKNQASCLQCHNQQIAPKQMIDKYGNFSNFENSDTIAMIYSKIPILHNAKEFILSAMILFFIFVILIFFVYKIHQKVTKIKEQNDLLMINQSRLASMGEMIENISHQLKQPLASIGSVLVNLDLYSQKNILTKEKLQEKIKDANSQIKFMSDTIENFKNFFNPNSPKSDFSSVEVINQAYKILQDCLNKYGIKIFIDIRQNFNHFGNKNEIIQILINIINNAKEAFSKISNDEKIIKISSFVDENQKFITIENNAGSIDEKIIDKIFEPHFTTKISGSGLGLYISKIIIQKNNGEISVKNVGENVLFTINFFHL